MPWLFPKKFRSSIDINATRKMKNSKLLPFNTENVKNNYRYSNLISHI